jgi:hypothetical protein
MSHTGTKQGNIVLNLAAEEQNGTQRPGSAKLELNAALHDALPPSPGTRAGLWPNHDCRSP